jgi:hypothetical protein
MGAVEGLCRYTAALRTWPSRLDFGHFQIGPHRHIEISGVLGESDPLTVSGNERILRGPKYELLLVISEGLKVPMTRRVSSNTAASITN